MVQYSKHIASYTPSLPGRSTRIQIENRGISETSGGIFIFGACQQKSQIYSLKHEYFQARWSELSGPSLQCIHSDNLI